MTTETRSAPTLPQRIVLQDVSWDYYRHTLRELDQQKLRITYDRGRMEIMSPSLRHERAKSVIGRLIEVYALEKDIAIRPMGSVTCRREDLQQGIEADECYYINRPVRSVDELDLSVDPPPDLAVEVDITSGSIPREPIYGALGVPEIWRFHGQKITVLHRRSDGGYQAADTSLAFPQLPLGVFNRFLDESLNGDEHAALKAFRDWVRQQTP